MLSISCNDCDASYVGQTKRRLRTRIKKPESNKKLDPNKQSVVSEHISKFNHSFDWNNIEVLDIEHNFFKRLISEVIHIKKQKMESINIQIQNYYASHIQ